MRLVVTAVICAVLGFSLGHVSATHWSRSRQAATDADPAGSSSAFPLDALLLQARAAPAYQERKLRGVKLFSIRPGAPISDLGLQNGDVVLGVGDIQLGDLDDLVGALAALDGTTTIHVERRGMPLDIPCHACGERLREVEPIGSDPVSSTTPEPTATSSLAVTNVPEGSIEQTDATHFVVKADMVHALDTSALARDARIVPAFESGETVGFKLWSIRPHSIYSQLGFQNGDVVRAVDGLQLTTPDNALAAYAKLREARAITVDVRRRGTPLVFEYELRD